MVPEHHPTDDSLITKKKKDVPLQWDGMAFTIIIKAQT